MTTDHELTFQQKGLFQQGYQHYTPDELRQLEWGLRFTPGVCSAITAVALYLQEPIALFVVAFLGMYAFFFPAGHPMDLIYNRGVRHLFGAVELPENPLPRRMACLAAGVMNSAAALLFLASMPTAAIVVGVMLLLLALGCGAASSGPEQALDQVAVREVAVESEKSAYNAPAMPQGTAAPGLFEEPAEESGQATERLIIRTGRIASQMKTDHGL